MRLCPIYSYQTRNKSQSNNISFGTSISVKNFNELSNYISNRGIKTIIVDWDINNSQVNEMVRRWYSRGGNISGGDITKQGGVGFFEEWNHSHINENSLFDRNNFLGYLAKYIKKQPKEIDILDAGCGEGKETKIFKELGYNLSGFDASSDCVQTARRNSGAPIVQATFNDFHSDKSFDAIWTRKAIQHVAKSGFADAIQNLVNHLKSDGILFGITKLDDNPVNGVGRQIFNENRLFHNLLTPRELLKVIENTRNARLIDIQTGLNRNSYDVTDTSNVTFVLQRK